MEKDKIVSYHAMLENLVAEYTGLTDGGEIFADNDLELELDRLNSTADLLVHQLTELHDKCEKIVDKTVRGK